MAAYAEGLNVLAKANIGAEDRAEGRRDRAADAPRVLPVRLRPGGHHRGVAARQRGVELAARPDRRGPRRRPRASTASPAASATRGEGRWTCTRRSTRACRRRCSALRCSSGSARGAAPTYANKILSAMRAQFGGHVEANGSGTTSRRRRLMSRADTTASRRRAGAVRRHRRPRQAQAVPRALPPRAARHAEDPGHRRGPQRLDRRGVPRPRPRGDHRRHPRRRRPR